MIEEQTYSFPKSLVDDYVGGMSLTSVAKKHQIHHKKARRILTENEIKIRPAPSSKVSRHAERIIKLYQEGLSTNQIGKKFRISGQNIRKFLHREKIRIRSRQEYCRRYIINIGNFREPSSEITSYWLGFLTANGQLKKNTKTGTAQLSVRASKANIGHLWKLAKDLNTTKPPRISRNGCYLSITNRELYDLLLSYGMLDIRDGVYRLPKDVDRRHWLRGFLDGKGEISIRGGRLKLELCLSVDKLAIWFNGLTDHPGVRRGGRISWSGPSAVGTARFLYCNSTRYLQSKWEIIRGFIFNA